jgi:hypothetical protein
MDSTSEVRVSWVSRLTCMLSGIRVSAPAIACDTGPKLKACLATYLNIAPAVTVLNDTFAE